MKWTADDHIPPPSRANDPNTYSINWCVISLKSIDLIDIGYLNCVSTRLTIQMKFSPWLRRVEMSPVTWLLPTTCNKASNFCCRIWVVPARPSVPDSLQQLWLIEAIFPSDVSRDSIMLPSDSIVVFVVDTSVCWCSMPELLMKLS